VVYAIMPRLLSRYFGELDYSPEAAFQFALGIPGFDDHTAFVFIEQPQNHPLVFMQSLARPDLCFIAVPVFVADPGYRLSLSPEDRSSLELPHAREPQIGADILCLALVTVSEGADPTANLASPIVLNLKNRTGIQSIQECSEYSMQHPLARPQELSTCS
jgi:flagellar assembly factor FliW